jgi:hypothetical protein
MKQNTILQAHCNRIYSKYMTVTHRPGFLVVHGLPHHNDPDLASFLHKSSMPETQSQQFPYIHYVGMFPNADTSNRS